MYEVHGRAPKFTEVSCSDYTHKEYGWYGVGVAGGGEMLICEHQDGTVGVT